MSKWLILLEETDLFIKDLINRGLTNPIRINQFCKEVSTKSKSTANLSFIPKQKQRTSRWVLNVEEMKEKFATYSEENKCEICTFIPQAILKIKRFVSFRLI